MKNKRTVFILLFLLIINISALATLAYNRWFKPAIPDARTDSGSSLPMLQKALDLENTQSLHMRRCRMVFVQETDPIQQKMQEKRLQLIEAMKTSDPDLSEIDKLIDEIIQLESEIQKKAVRRILEDKTVLSPHQQERFFDMFEHQVGRRDRDCCPEKKTDER
ncbi:MAG: periplasmic heavy metal sensor [Candidatus Aminicenantes bacterium]|nr:periplasmic heavy metal sensor [Candidatus Aminicenantes bacterium]